MRTGIVINFSMQEWRKIYRKVHELGKILKDSRPTYDEDGNYFSPKTNLSTDAQKELEVQIKTWVQRNNRYLDQCGMKPRKPTWYYDKKNPDTHMSSSQFKYGHLVSMMGV